jgi:hypothetical protein
MANTVGNVPSPPTPPNPSCLVTPNLSNATIAEVNKSPEFYPSDINEVSAMPRKHTTKRLTDSMTGQEYLVDSGAEVSVFPANDWDRKSAPSERLLPANGSTIAAFGKRSIHLCFGESHYSQDLYIADVTQPILGANFFIRNHLLIDWANARITREIDWSHIAATATPEQARFAGLHKVRRDVYKLLLAKFPELLVPTLNPNQTKHSTEHFITTNGPPLHARAC